MSSIELHHATPVKVAIAIFIARLSPEYPPVRPSLDDIMGDLPFHPLRQNLTCSFSLQLSPCQRKNIKGESRRNSQAGRHGRRMDQDIAASYYGGRKSN